MRLKFYAHPWHLRSSAAFKVLCFEVFEPVAPTAYVPWDGTALPPASGDRADAESVHIFCQWAPPRDFVESKSHVVWLPMWDNIHLFPPAWWMNLPRQLRVVAFSRGIAERAKMAGLPVLELKYHLDPARCAMVDWKGDRKLLYWNRQGLISASALRQLCKDLNIAELLLRNKLDPGTPAQARLCLGEQLGATKVTHLPQEMQAHEFQQLYQQAQLMIVPRVLEGVGLVMLEAMAHGCCVLAWNAPTMNEYIEPGRNGLFFSPPPIGFALRVRRRIAWTLAGWNRTRASMHYFPVLNAHQWKHMPHMNLEKLGIAARRDQQLGHQAWNSNLSGYRDFVLNW